MSHPPTKNKEMVVSFISVLTFCDTDLGSLFSFDLLLKRPSNKTENIIVAVLVDIKNIYFFFEMIDFIDEILEIVEEM
jgi:hypothetical protein